eukprot:XP_008768606.1 PREDICTED: DNA polymerase nu isoform X4 [Rattus norvegicus]
MKMENYEACVGFDLCETPLSTVAQKIMSAMRSGDLMASRNEGERTKTSEVTKKPSVHFSVLAEHEKTQPLETKNPKSLINQTPRGSVELSSQPSITKLSAGQVQNSISSSGLSSYLIPQCDQEASVLQNREHKRKHFLKENIGKEDKDSLNLKRKYITCSNSPEKASKHTALGKETDGTESWQNSEDTRALGKQLCDVRYLGDLAKVQLMDVLKQAAALVVTLMYKDGSTQLSAKQALTCPVKGIVVLLKSHVGSSPLILPAHGGALGKDFTSTDHCIYIHTEQSPFWDPKQEAHSLFVRNILFWTLRCKCPVVCFNAKDFVRTVLQLYGEDGSWKHVAGFVGLDPRVAAWLIDPSDTAPSFEDLVAKHLEKSIIVKPSSTFNDASINIVSQNVCVNLKILYDLTMDLCSKLKAYGLWQLFCTLELPLIPILAVMENHKISIDKEEMERTSALLGAHLKKLEQEAHFVAGEQFLIMSNNQLREILFGKLKLHLLSQRKHLPRTGLQNQLSTSEAMLNSLQDLHPLPKIILEYRQVHKIKSTFIDGLLAYMKKGSISSTWNQTGTVTGRLSAKHPEGHSHRTCDTHGQRTDQESGVLRGLWSRERTACCLPWSHCFGSNPLFGAISTEVQENQGLCPDSYWPVSQCRLVAQIHDELLFEVEDTQIPEFAGASRGAQWVVYPTVRKFPISLKLLLSVSQGFSQLSAYLVTLVRDDICLVLQNSHEASVHKHLWLKLPR